MKHTVKGDTVTVYLDGELDHHTAKGVRAELEALIESPRVKRLVLDLSGLTFMDSSGIAVLMRALRQMQQLGGSLRVTAIPLQARRVLDAAGVGRLITLE